MSIYNKYFPSWIKGDNIITQGSGYADNVSLRNDGKTELRGDTYISNSGRLMINKDKNSSTQYYLDVSGNSNFNGDIVLSNKNKLSQVQYITASTTLTFGSAEYISITTAATNSIITLPTVTTASQIGCKFTFFFGTNNYPTISISGATSQTIVDNIYSIVANSINISYSRSFVELLCVSLTAPQWALSNGANDYNLFPQTSTDNNFSGINTFPTQLTSDNSTRVATTAYVKSNLSSYQTAAGMSSYALIASPTFTGTPLTTTPISTDNSTRIASTAYVKSNLSSYQTTVGMSFYALLSGPSFTGNPTTTTQLATDNSTRIASTAYVQSNLSSYQPISSMGDYVLQTYLDANYNTSAYIANNYASLSINNIFLGGASFAGTVSLKNNSSITNSKIFSITSGSTLNSDLGSTTNLNGTTSVSGAMTFNTGSTLTINSGMTIYTADIGSNDTSPASTAFVCNKLAYFPLLTYTDSHYASLTANNTITGTNYFTGANYFRTPNESSSIRIGNGLQNNASGYTDNLSIGINALSNSTTSNYNMAIGNGAMNSVVAGVAECLALGIRALESFTTGHTNIAIGYVSGYKLTSGSNNSFFGFGSGAGFSTGDDNFCMGVRSLTTYNSPEIAASTNVNRNLALGTSAIAVGFSGIQDNCAVGFSALGNPANTTNASLKGSYNVAIGSYAGFGLDGASSNNNVFIGYNTGIADGPSSSFSTTSYSNITGINCGVISSPGSNSIYLGNSSIINNYLYGTLNLPNISFTGTLNTISTTVFSYLSGVTSNIQTQINNMLNGNTGFGNVKLNGKYWISGNAVITGNISLTTYPIANEFWSVNVTTATTITLATITAQNIGTKLTFRRTGGTTTVAVSFIGNGTQSVFNLTNTGGTTAQALMPSGSYSVTLVALYQTSTSTFGWYQI